MEISNIFWTLKSAFQNSVVTAVSFECDLQLDGKMNSNKTVRVWFPSEMKHSEE